MLKWIQVDSETAKEVMSKMSEVNTSLVTLLTPQGRVDKMSVKFVKPDRDVSKYHFGAPFIVIIQGQKKGKSIGHISEAVDDRLERTGSYWFRSYGIGKSDLVYKLEDWLSEVSDEGGSIVERGTFKDLEMLKRAITDFVNEYDNINDWLGVPMDCQMCGSQLNRERS